MFKIRRRKFLIFSTLLGVSPYIKAREVDSFTREFNKIEPLIKEVQVHMFPEQSAIPSAKSMNATEFVLTTMIHQSYDKDIRNFVLEGAQELSYREKGKFITMSYDERERALRAYEETNYGSSWLSRIMTLTMEAMFSDPIYGSNIKEGGWKALDTYGGVPRPKTRYIGL